MKRWFVVDTTKPGLVTFEPFETMGAALVGTDSGVPVQAESPEKAVLAWWSLKADALQFRDPESAKKIRESLDKLLSIPYNKGMD